MTRYLLSIYQPDGPPPGPEVLDQVGMDLHELLGHHARRDEVRQLHRVRR
jgi:hypothetical protein